MIGAEPGRVSPSSSDIDTQLARLVVVLLDLVRQLMERQAEHRMAAGGLSETQIERLGAALLRLAQRIDDLKTRVGAKAQNGPQVDAEHRDYVLADVVDRLLVTGAAVEGDITLGLADIELVRIGLRLVARTIDI